VGVGVGVGLYACVCVCVFVYVQRGEQAAFTINHANSKSLES